MKVMKNKWCWIGLVLCTSSLAWAAKDKHGKSHSDAKESAEASSATSDKGGKDETAEEDEAPKAETKKPTKTEVTADLKPPESKAFDIAPVGSFGSSSFTRFGLGLRLGLNWGEKDGLYIGLIGTRFGGSSVTQERVNGTAQISRSTTVLAAELGYDVDLGKDWVARPYLSPGAVIVADKECATGSCWEKNGTKLTISPGLQVAYLVAPVLYLGGDVRYQIIMNTSDASAAVFSLVLGLRI
jgi:hypothetical protein